MGQFQLIPEFFDGRDVFITGGSGLIGKTLIEKILYSCSSINRIFLLLRAIKGQNVEERLEYLKKSVVFDRIRTKAPELLDKMVAVEGDVSEQGLAGVLVNQERLSNVSVIIHGAATVRFDDPLKKVVNINVCGTREILQFAETLTNLQVFFHISTTYCYTEFKNIQEEMFPASGDWRKILDIVDKLDDEVVNAMEKKMLGHHPNTYTFSKNLSEHLVYEYRQKVPIVIYRPSIIISAVKEPFAGWIDNVNGLAGLLMAICSGMVRTAYADNNALLDLNPIDLTVKAMIVAIRRQGVRSKEEIFSSAVPIYNGSSGQDRSISSGIVTLCNSCIPTIPFDYIMWPMSSLVTTTCFLLYYILVVFLQLVPAILIDVIIRLTGRPPIVMKMQRRLYHAQNSLAYFMQQTFVFENKNFLSLQSDLHGSDVDSFTFNYYDDVDDQDYFIHFLLGARRYILGQKDETLPLARRRFALACFVRNTLQMLFYVVIALFTFNYVKNHYAVTNWRPAFWH